MNLQEPTSWREFVVRQRDLAQRTINDLIPPGTRVALLDFPAYSNVGDSAIWLGQLALLRAAGARVVYAASRMAYRPRALERAVGRDGVVLISGGGNLGDLWPPHQQFRERVLDEHPGCRIIQLPQSIHFDHATGLNRAQAVFAGHRGFVLMVRDHRSLAMAEDLVGDRARLCPDMSFGLGPLPRTGEPDVDLAVHRRDDHEGPVPPPGGPATFDWLTEDRWTRLLSRLANGRFGGLTVVRPLMTRVAARRLGRGCRLLSSARIIVTNRLHGHLLCVLMDIPHFVSDTVQGKVRAYLETWAAPRQNLVLCASEAEAVARARGYLESGQV